MSSRQTAQLVKMANQIARHVAPAGDVDAAAAQTANHLRRFWSPAMRQQLCAHWRAGGDDLLPAVARALEGSCD